MSEKLKNIGLEVLKRKGAEEVFITSDGSAFLIEDFAIKHAAKKMLQVIKVLKPKKRKK